MHAFKIAGLVILALWMSFITIQIIEIRRMAYTGCAWAYAAANPVKPGQQDNVAFCPP
jgi:hypothetical protein